MIATLLKRDSNKGVFLLIMPNFRTPPVAASESYILNLECLEHLEDCIHWWTEASIYKASIYGLFEGN